MDSWITETIRAGGYWGILFLMFLENVFPPIPSELIMPLAGYVVSQQQLSFIGIVLAGTLGSVLGALPLYYLGHKVGGERLKRLADRHGYWLGLSGNDIEAAIAWFNRHGKKTIFFCRLVPGIRSLISVPAGISRMKLPGFLLLTTIGSAIWTALLAWLGLLMGRNFEMVGHYIDPVSKVVFGILILAYLIRVLRHRHQRLSQNRPSS